MDYFKIGEKVVVSATIYHIYIDGRRKWLREQLIYPKEGFYVGYTYKQEGTLVAGEGDFQSCLRDIKSIKVLRIKFSDWGNDKFALLQDVRKIR